MASIYIVISWISDLPHRERRDHRPTPATTTTTPATTPATTTPATTESRIYQKH